MSKHYLQASYMLFLVKTESVLECFNVWLFPDYLITIFRISIR